VTLVELLSIVISHLYKEKQRQSQSRHCRIILAYTLALALARSGITFTLPAV